MNKVIPETIKKCKEIKLNDDKPRDMLMGDNSCQGYEYYTNGLAIEKCKECKHYFYKGEQERSDKE